ncbi:MAG: hypothetical protein IJP86_02895 [Synergistaceae bacterium]|nr:hypothetical protein [Synergistaceae bacterium]
MVKKSLACLLLLVSFAPGAWAESHIWFTHASVTGMNDGKADFSDARFSNVFFSVVTDIPVTKESAQITGSMTLSGGSYSFWNGTELQKVSGTPMTYTIALENGVEARSDAPYEPFTELSCSRRGDFRAGTEADSGLKGVNVSWNFPDKPDYNGTFTFPDMMTTQEQLESCVLYFEYIRSGEDVTGINWRIVKASDTATPVPQDFDMGLYVFGCVGLWREQNPDS